MITCVLFATLAALQTASPAAMLEAVKPMTTATSNEARFDAVTAFLRARNVPFEVERFTIAKAIGSEPRTEGRNIVATFGPAGPALVVGGHYDAVRLQDSTLSHGATDNAGSSAILLKIAESLAAQPPAGRVTLVWFDMEELGLIGSQKYIETHPSDRIRAMVNLDVNAYGDTVLFGASRGTANAAPRQALLETCAALDTGCIGFAQMPPGDDRSFEKAGIPALSIAILPALEVHQLWLLLNAEPGSAAKLAMPAILQTLHTAADTIEKVDATAMARQADFVLALVRRLDARR